MNIIFFVLLIAMLFLQAFINFKQNRQLKKTIDGWQKSIDLNTHLLNEIEDLREWNRRK